MKKPYKSHKEEILDIKYIMQLYFQGEVTLTDKEFIALRGRKMELEKML